MSKGRHILGFIFFFVTWPIYIPLMMCGVCDVINTHIVVEPTSTRQAHSENPIGVQPPPTQKEVEDNPVNF
jgi:hypothetical protein